ncbi:MAG: hypothetical protein D5R97_00075 [Candidatus Syntrophonatronum acetioxidans]|uniref:GerMN domain-containing protein n=1 Tax=Candidatus Syntrophonatronum acetioxidans TaxID=1795816 RepID=A0A424YJF9_9FIRM|nr:MAG: hypothetical protein D5R97_00075 [Candidatus Syntrophonatronum acetioxidans]
MYLRSKVKGLWFLVILLLLLSFSLGGGCGLVEQFMPGEEEGPVEEFEEEPAEENFRDTVFYYHYGNDYLVPVEFSIPWNEGIARAALNRIISSGQMDPILQEKGLKAPLPSGTEIRGLTIREGLAIIDFNQEFLNVPEGQERIVLDSLIYTLTEFTTVNQVEVMIEGEYLEEFPPGDPLDQPLDRSRSLNLEISPEVEDLKDTSQVVVYFCGWGEGDLTYMVPVTRVIPSTSNLVEGALKELLKGPRPDTELYSDLNPQAEINSITLEEGVATVDFNKDFLIYDGGVKGEENIIKQIVLTLTQFPEIKEVRILVEGVEPDLVWDQPMGAPEKINMFNDF